MFLTKLLDGITTAPKNIEITDITSDSRAVKTGSLFIALPGTKMDGAKFIPQAIKNGAAAILTTPNTPQTENTLYITHENPRRALALIAARFWPSQPEHIAAITGTNGKTSISVFCRQLWELSGHNAASLGTIGLVTKNKTEYRGLTTLDSIQLHQTLDHAARENISHLALEASSIGMHQHRLDGVNIAIAAFTNLTRDHLDYHQNFENYLAAKLYLFTDLLSPDGTAILNADMDVIEPVKNACIQRKLKTITYGKNGNDIRLEKINPHASGLDITATLFGKKHEISFPLVGTFQAYNALCAAGMVIASGEDQNKTVANLEKLQNVPGRMQKSATHPNGACVYVDYAHTPDALENALQSIRPHATGRVIVAVGAGGDRDKGKRPLMGKAAADNADLVIITDDNPRSEDPAAIRADILTACPTAIEATSRENAIDQGIRMLKPGDVFLIAGKGHETGIEINGEIFPFDDREIAAKIATQLKKEQAA